MNGNARFLSVSRWIFRKEFRSFLGSNLPAVTIAVISLLCGLVSVLLATRGGMTLEGVTRSLFHAFYIFNIIAGLFLSMGAFVSERRQGTMELLYTLPVSDVEMTLGKFLMGVFLMGVLNLAMVVIYVLGIAESPLYMAFGGLIGLFLVGLYAYSVGIFASSLTDNYLVSLLLGGGILFAIDIGGFFAGLLPEPAKGILTHFHALHQYFPFTRGVLPLEGVVFFGSMIFLFLFLTVKVLESRRWRGQGN